MRFQNYVIIMMDTILYYGVATELQQDINMAAVSITLRPMLNTFTVGSKPIFILARATDFYGRTTNRNIRIGFYVFLLFPHLLPVE